MNFKLSQYSIITDALDADSLAKDRLIYSTRTGKATIITQPVLNDLKNSNFNNIPEKILNKLLECELIVPKNSNELSQVLEEFKIGSNEGKTLGYTITPTANCQLGCEYCGQIHRKINIDSSLEEKMYKHLKEKLEKRDYEHLDVTWYGAEPLMGYSAIKSLSSRILTLTKSQGMTYSAGMITNGLSLKEPIFVDLVENYNVRSYQITIDGVKETHDNSRMTKNNNPTFDLIFKNVIAAVNNPIYKKKKCLITIRVNVSKINYKEVDALLELIYRKKIHDKVAMSFAPIHDWGNNDADSEIGLTPGEFSDLEIDWTIKMRQLGFRKNNLIPERTYSTCMTTSPDSELIDANGEISYCWEVPYTEGLDNDESLVIGNLNNKGDVYKKDAENAPLRNWYNDIEEGKHNSTNCRSCEFLPVCGGSCPLSWFKGKPACPSFKFNIQDRLVLEYLTGKMEI